MTNLLSEAYREIYAQLATPDKNLTIDCRKYKLWNCEKGHKYKTTVGARINGYSCPECYGDKNYVCNFENCDYSCTQFGSLITHIKRHNNDRQYICLYYCHNPNCMMPYNEDGKCINCEDNFLTKGCGSTYVTFSHLKSHILSAHSEKSSKHKKLKEEDMYNYLNSNYENISREFQIKFSLFDDDEKDDNKANGCTSRHCRIDFIFIYKNLLFLIEVDENQHKQYESFAELVRLNSIVSELHMLEQFSEYKKVLIRFNPDNFTHNGKNTKITKEKRQEILHSWIQNYVPESDLEVLYFFYDDINGKVILPDEYRYIDSHVLIRKENIAEIYDS